MPILDPDPTGPVTEDTPAQIAKPTYKGVTVDTHYEPADKLLSHVEGMSWTVNYYSQVLGQDSSVGGQGLAIPAAQQQYRLIKNFELKVTTSLQTSQDPESGEMVLRGTANVYPRVRPNKGDMFLGDIGDGREAVFQVTEVTRNSIFTDSVYTIEYRAADYSVEVRRADLDSKTVQVLYFVKDFITYGQNPLLFEEEHDHYTYLTRQSRIVLDTYLRSFYSRDRDTILLPGQTATTYDPFMMKAMVTFFSVLDGEAMYQARQFNMDEDQAIRATSIWDALLWRDVKLVKRAFKNYGTVSTKAFHQFPLYEGIAYSGVQKVIYPTDAQLSVDYLNLIPSKTPDGEALNFSAKDMSMQEQAGGRLPALADAINYQINGLYPMGAEVQEGLLIPPVVNQAMAGGSYVFSKAFYEQSKEPGAQSQLELMTWTYLKDHNLSFEELRRVMDDVDNWTALDRFYFVPVLLVLVRSRLRKI